VHNPLDEYKSLSPMNEEKRNFGVGDLIIITVSESAKGHVNTATYEILSIDGETGYFNCRGVDGAEKTIDPVAFSYLDHAYCITPQKAQGMSCHYPSSGYGTTAQGIRGAGSELEGVLGMGALSGSELEYYHATMSDAEQSFCGQALFGSPNTKQYNAEVTVRQAYLDDGDKLDSIIRGEIPDDERVVLAQKVVAADFGNSGVGLEEGHGTIKLLKSRGWSYDTDTKRWVTPISNKEGLALLGDANPLADKNVVEAGKELIRQARGMDTIDVHMTETAAENSGMINGKAIQQYADSKGRVSANDDNVNFSRVVGSNPSMTHVVNAKAVRENLVWLNKSTTLDNETEFKDALNTKERAAVKDYKGKITAAEKDFKADIKLMGHSGEAAVSMQVFVSKGRNSTVEKVVSVSFADELTTEETKELLRNGFRKQAVSDSKGNMSIDGRDPADSKTVFTARILNKKALDFMGLEHPLSDKEYTTTVNSAFPHFPGAVKAEKLLSSQYMPNGTRYGADKQKEINATRKAQMASRVAADKAHRLELKKWHGDKAYAKARRGGGKRQQKDILTPTEQNIAGSKEAAAVKADGNTYHVRTADGVAKVSRVVFGNRVEENVHIVNGKERGTRIKSVSNVVNGVKQVREVITRPGGELITKNEKEVTNSWKYGAVVSEVEVIDGKDKGHKQTVKVANIGSKIVASYSEKTADGKQHTSSFTGRIEQSYEGAKLAINGAIDGIKTKASELYNDTLKPFVDAFVDRIAGFGKDKQIAANLAETMKELQATVATADKELAKPLEDVAKHAQAQAVDGQSIKPVETDVNRVKQTVAEKQATLDEMVKKYPEPEQAKGQTKAPEQKQDKGRDVGLEIPFGGR